MTTNVSRRGFLGAIGLLPLMGLGGLSGCGKTGVKGKTLYYISVCNNVALGKMTKNAIGSETTIVFDNDDGWHYAGSFESSGTWTQEDDNIVLNSSELGTLTLKKVDDEDAYIPSGDEEYGERYFLSEDDAKKYYEDYTGKAVARVKELLESQEWERSNRPESMASPEEINFDSGKIAFKKASYNQKGYLFIQGPSDDEWAASDHLGKYSLTVKDQRAKDTDSTPRPLVYKGELTVDGATVAYTLEKRNDSLVLKLGETMYDPVFANGK